jgi:Calcineurin-like phosphoesterase
VRELLAPLQTPVYVLPGNHDDRRALHRNFGVPGADGEPAQYAVDLGPLRLVVLDTTRPGEDAGALDAELLGWLDAELATSPELPTLLAMHHPPFVTGVPACDAGSGQIAWPELAHHLGHERDAPLARAGLRGDSDHRGRARPSTAPRAHCSPTRDSSHLATHAPRIAEHRPAMRNDNPLLRGVKLSPTNACDCSGREG